MKDVMLTASERRRRAAVAERQPKRRTPGDILNAARGGASGLLLHKRLLAAFWRANGGRRNDGRGQPYGKKLAWLKVEDVGEAADNQPHIKDGDEDELVAMLVAWFRPRVSCWAVENIKKHAPSERGVGNG